MKFRSKIDLWYHFVHVLLAALVLWLVIIFSSEGNVAAGVVALALFACEIYISLILGSVYYALEENALLVRRGPGRKLRIAYEDINSAEETRQVRLFSALSADALEVKYNTDGIEKAVVISPEKKREFLEKMEMKMGRVIDKDKGVTPSESDR